MCQDLPRGRQRKTIVFSPQQNALNPRSIRCGTFPRERNGSRKATKGQICHYVGAPLGALSTATSQVYWDIQMYFTFAHPVPLADIIRPRSHVLPSVGATEYPDPFPYAVLPLPHENVATGPRVNSVTLMTREHCEGGPLLTTWKGWKSSESRGYVSLRSLLSRSMIWLNLD